MWYTIMIGEQYEKAKVLDQFISDIRNGVVKIVPCGPSEEMLRDALAADVYGRTDIHSYDDPEKVYKIMLSASPIYEPIKKFLGDEK